MLAPQVVAMPKGLGLSAAISGILYAVHSLAKPSAIAPSVSKPGRPLTYPTKCTISIKPLNYHQPSTTPEEALARRERRAGCWPLSAEGSLSS